METYLFCSPFNFEFGIFGCFSNSVSRSFAVNFKILRRFVVGTGHLNVAPQFRRQSIATNRTIVEMSVLRRLVAIAGLVFESEDGSTCN